MEKTAIQKRSIRRTFAVAILWSFVMLLFANVAVSAELIPVTMQTTKEKLNIRSQADTYSEILTIIDKEGTVLYPVEHTTANWYKVRFADNIYGYVFKTYVKEGPALNSEVSAIAGAGLRTEAKSTAAKRRLLSVGTSLSISGQDGDWYYAKAYNNEVGYIAKSSVKAFAITYPKAVRPDAQVPDISFVEATTAATYRSGPSTSKASLGNATKGTLLTVLSSSKESDNHTWYKVNIPGGSQGYVRDDVVKVYSTAALEGKTITIDPGHGSYKSSSATAIDKGNVGVSGALEKDINLKIARYLQAYLNKAGANVVMTRTGDKGVMTLVDRANIANNAKSDVFISVHCNASSNNAKKVGTVSYFFGGSNTTPVNATLVTKRKALAEKMQRMVYTELGSTNLGFASDNFTVLVRTTMPSVLIELGYLSNAGEEAKLKTDSYQLLCAQGMMKGLLRYYE